MNSALRINCSFLLVLMTAFSLYACKNGKAITTGSAVWYTLLPNCPCENPDRDRVRLNDGWAKDAADLNKYHKGASASFRSYPPVATSAGKSCQQCCYDEHGKLITEGSGAGTPDKVSTCDGENERGEMKIKYSALLGHYTEDVKPWENLGGADSGWVRYNKLWLPNNGNGCH